MSEQKTEPRIHYDSIDIKYNPNAEEWPWELWVDGEHQLSHTSPREVLEVWAMQSEGTQSYVTADGEPWHERKPDRYERHEVYASPAMELELAPSEDVQATIWLALKDRDEDGALHLDTFCETREFALDEAVRAARVLSSHGSDPLVDWGTSPRSIWLSPEGRECDWPEWLLTEEEQDR